MHKRRAPTFLQRFVQYVWRIRPEIWLEVFTYRRPRELFQIALQFGLRVTPRKVCVRLCKAPLGQAVHHARPRECFREKNRVGIAHSQSAQTPLPEGQRLRVRVVNAKHAHAAVEPRIQTLNKARPRGRANRAIQNSADKYPGISWEDSPHTESIRRAG